MSTESNLLDADHDIAFQCWQPRTRPNNPSVLRASETPKPAPQNMNVPDGGLFREPALVHTDSRSLQKSGQNSKKLSCSEASYATGTNRQ
jgi:hypothetical protein